MKNQKQIIINIDRVGRIPKMEVKGYIGRGCVEATKELEELLSDGNIQREEKPEFYQNKNKEIKQDLRRM